MVKNRLYTLLHITSKKNYKQIKKSNKLLPSVHNVSENKIQWLGNGIYFWDSNDDLAISTGKNLVKGRFKCSKLVGITVNVKIDLNKHLDLENGYWNQLYIQFLKKLFPENYKKLVDYMNMVKTMKKIDTFNLNKIGVLTGDTIDLFLNVLKNKKIEIDMVSGYFLHGRSDSFIFNRSSKMIRQFCVKNENIVNNIVEDWIIDYNI